LIINPVTAFTTGTLQLPPASSATNDQEITVVFTAGVTDLTVASAGATVLGAPIRIGAYDSFRVRYNAGQLKWYTLDTTGDGSGPTASILRQDFAGDGVTTNYTLAEIPPALGETLQIFIDGVYQERASYNIAGAFLIFSAPPPNGTVIEVLSWDALGGGTTTADLVSYNRDSGGVLTTVAEETRPDNNYQRDSLRAGHHSRCQLSRRHHHRAYYPHQLLRQRQDIRLRRRAQLHRGDDTWQGG
jgi:hypothetical protein